MTCATCVLVYVHQSRRRSDLKPRTVRVPAGPFIWTSKPNALCALPTGEGLAGPAGNNNNVRRQITERERNYNLGPGNARNNTINIVYSARVSEQSSSSPRRQCTYGRNQQSSVIPGGPGNVFITGKIFFISILPKLPHFSGRSERPPRRGGRNFSERTKNGVYYYFIFGHFVFYFLSHNENKQHFYVLQEQ